MIAPPTVSLQQGALDRPTSPVRGGGVRVESPQTQVPAEIRERVLSCADASQLETWGDRAATAATIDDVFGS